MCLRMVRCPFINQEDIGSRYQQRLVDASLQSVGKQCLGTDVLQYRIAIVKERIKN